MNLVMCQWYARECGNAGFGQVDGCQFRRRTAPSDVQEFEDRGDGAGGVLGVSPLFEDDRMLWQCASGARC